MRRHFRGAVLATGVVFTGCGEAVVTRIDGGNENTIFVDAGARDAGVDAGVDAGHGFTRADAGSDGGCQITMCLTGAPSRGSTNTPFDVICDDPAVPGVLKSVDGVGSYNTFNTATVDAKKTLWPKLFAALDTNGDNAVNSADRQCTVNLLGYSWGGVSAVQIAQAMTDDSRVDGSMKHIGRLFVIDPFQPILTFQGPLKVPTTVSRFIEFRHSVSPSNDCSRGLPFSPYEGIAPRCYPSQSCFDYDYSQTPSASYPSAEGGSYFGSQIGHCEAPEVASLAVLADFKGLAYPVMPPPQAIKSP